MTYLTRQGVVFPMATLTANKRNALPSSAFAEPKSRKYPIYDKSHAQNAKARATQMESKGKLSESARDRIDAKANKVLHRGKKK